MYFRIESVKQSNNLRIELDQIDKTQQQKDLELKQKIEQQIQVIEQLKKDVQAKADKKAQEAAQPSIVAQVVSYAVGTAQASQGAPEDPKLFIYMHESGNNPYAVNKSSGACGLAQALPCSKMPCALGDYACQDNWATAYMISRYGTWANAKAFWLRNRWW